MACAFALVILKKTSWCVCIERSFLCGLLFSFGEAEGGEDDGYGGECHGCAADEGGEVSAGGKRDADDVVDECPEEVLADGGHGETGEGECACDGGEV